MSKYKIDKQLGIIRYFKPPNNTALAGFLGDKMWIPSWLWSDKEMSVSRHKIKSFDGGEFEILFYEPKDIDDTSPCMLYIHGGGFVYGASPFHYRIAKRYAVEGGCRLAFVRYRRAPKHPFPTPAEDCYAAYCWLLDNAKELRIDKAKIAIGGDSAGGCLAAALSQMTRDRGIQIPLFQMLIYPVIDRRMNTESNRIFTDTPMWNSRLSVAMWKCYLTNPDTADIAYASPIEAKSFEDLPPAYIETAELDCLRDEAIEYATALKNAGVHTEENHTKATIHGYDSAESSDVSKASVKTRLNYIKNMFK